MSRVQQETEPILDFKDYVAERTRYFAGREWVFEKIDGWLADPAGSRFFLLTGKVGSGKTAIAARLQQFSEGNAAPPPGLGKLGPGFLSAYHFCSSRDANWIDPTSFTRSVALQLTRRHQEIALALKSIGEKTINIRVDIGVGKAESGSNVTGIVINNFDVSGLNARDAFNRTVLDPLREAHKHGFDAPVVILVDALDESLSHEGNPKIVQLLARLRNLPPGVRFILTGRDDARVESEFQADGEYPQGVFISEASYTKSNTKDMGDYLRRRLSEDGVLKKKLSDFSPTRAASIVRLITTRARGNFQYVSFVLDGLSLGRRSFSDLRKLPPGLYSLYHDSLKQMVASDGDWEKKYAPVIGVLSVAQESLFRDQLESFTGNVKTVADGLRKFKQFIEATSIRDGQATAGSRSASHATVGERYRLYHQSVIEFLRRKSFDVDVLGGATKSLDNAYYLPSEDWDARVADFYMPPKQWAKQLDKFSKYAADWLKWNNYGLRHVPAHLAEAAGGLDRHEQTERLVKLVLNPEFQQTHQTRVGDASSLGRSLELSLRVAARDDDPSAFQSVFDMAYGVVAFRLAQLRPEQIFELARRGDVEAAERQLLLFGAELEWHQATLLSVAWLAAGQNPEAAQRLFERVFKELVGLETLRLFADRVGASLYGTGAPSGSADLLPPPSEEAAMLVVERMGGMVDPSGMEMLLRDNYSNVTHQNMEMLQQALSPEGGLDSEGILDRNYAGGIEEGALYLAAKDGPILVSYAVADVKKGSEYLKSYLDIHAANGYVAYRNRSFWFLLAPVLRHPDDGWAREFTSTLSMLALAGGNREFSEGVPVTLLGLMAASSGGSGAQKKLDEFRKWMQKAALGLSRERNTEGDSWGTHRRRFASLAHVAHALMKDNQASGELLMLALDLPFGFAGFQAPTNLMLAETAHVCGINLIDRALEAARASAHNIQDWTFCARTTARVNAMRLRWWGTVIDVADEAARFVENLGNVKFAAQHTIGEEYVQRTLGPGSAPLPDWMREADTLRMLARVYSRPLSEFEHLNRGLGADDSLPAGTQVNVPDPGFTPLLAARLSAEALADPMLMYQERVAIIQSLVPAAVANVTALDTVLSRLLLAAEPDEKRRLDSLMKVAVESMRSQTNESWDGWLEYAAH